MLCRQKKNTFLVSHQPISSNTSFQTSIFHRPVSKSETPAGSSTALSTASILMARCTFKIFLGIFHLSFFVFAGNLSNTNSPRPGVDLKHLLFTSSASDKQSSQFDSSSSTFFSDTGAGKHVPRASKSWLVRFCVVSTKVMETMKSQGRDTTWRVQGRPTTLGCGQVPLCWNEHGMTQSLLLLLSVWYFQGA